MRDAKKNIVFAICSFLSLFFLSCEEDFNPKFDFEGRYVLNGVFSSGTDTKGLPEIKLGRIYNIDSYDISKYNVEPVINAEVTLINKGNEIVFCETHKRTSQEAFYVDTSTNGEFIVFPDQEFSVRVKLPNGKLMTAKTKIPHENSVSIGLLMPKGFSTLIDREFFGNSFNLSWAINNSKNIFFPSISVYYSEIVGNLEVYKIKEIPTHYIKRNGRLEPFFPSAQYAKTINYEFSAIDSAISELSYGRKKESIKLYWLIVRLLEFNNDLSNYYSSIYGMPDRFTLRLEDKVFSNVEGGYRHTWCYYY